MFFAMLCAIAVFAIIIVGSGKPVVIRDLAAAGDFYWS